MKATMALLGVLLLASCGNAYLSAAQQTCIFNTGVAIQNDKAAADLRPQQKAALIADACGISIDAILMKATLDGEEDGA